MPVILYTLCADAKKILFTFVCALHGQIFIRAAQVLIVCNYRDSFTAGSYRLPASQIISSALVSSFPPWLYWKSLTPRVCVETCESLCSSLASVASSDHSSTQQAEAQTLEQIDALTGVRQQRHKCMKLAQSGCCVSPHTQTWSLSVTTADSCSAGLS